MLHEEYLRQFAANLLQASTSTNADPSYLQNRWRHTRITSLTSSSPSNPKRTLQVHRREHRRPLMILVRPRAHDRALPHRTAQRMAHSGARTSRMIVGTGHRSCRIPVGLRHLIAGGQVPVGARAQTSRVHRPGTQRARSRVEIGGRLVQVTVVHRD